jgi:hypothetical protein
MMAALTLMDWVLIAIIGILLAGAALLCIGRLIGGAWDAQEERRRNHPLVDWAAVERDTQALRRLVPSVTTPMYAGNGSEEHRAAERRRRMARIQKDAVRTALLDFHKGTTTRNQHAPQTIGHQHWQNNYDRVMADQRATSAEHASSLDTAV